MSADKKRIWIDGQLVDVSDEVYAAYMQGDRKIRYFEADLKVERVIYGEDGTIRKTIPSREDSLDRLMDDNAEQFPDARKSVEDTVFCKISEDKLHRALATLSQNERQIIYALFFEEMTQREVAQELGISQPAVNKQKNRILKKLKLFLED